MLSVSVGVENALKTLTRYSCPIRTICQTACCSSEFTTSPPGPEFAPGSDSNIDARPLPLITSRKLLFPHPVRPAKQAWLETLSTPADDKLGIVDLHPDVFATFPRIDILWWNQFWQSLYRHVNYEFVRNRAEMPGGGRKPWQQKGTGRARHGSIRSPLWHGGGRCFGPRGPKTYFFMLPYNMRVLGLRVALSCKYAQNNLHIVESLDIPSDSPAYLRDVIECKGWGLSALFVDDTDVVPKNIAVATNSIPEYNIMPVYGLNVHSMLKHETLILTLAALEKIEERLLTAMHRFQHKENKFDRTTMSQS